MIIYKKKSSITNLMLIVDKNQKNYFSIIQNENVILITLEIYQH